MRHLIIIFFAALLSACQLPLKPDAPPSAGTDADAEVRRLFAQKYIDPLTRYIQANQDNPHKSAQLRRVQAEREQRCQAIAARFAQRAATQANLQKFQAGYEFSCAAEVAAFAERVQNQPATAVEAEDSEEIETEADSEAEIETTTQSLVAKQKPSPQSCQQSIQQHDYPAAFKHCQAAAEQGNAQAQTALAHLYENGKGVIRDDAQAVFWYRKAALQGDSAAQSTLGVRYYTGEGVEKDYTQAAAWQRKAAEQGYPDAQYILGMMYELGQGVPQDFIMAYQWFLLAAANGAEGALQARQSLASKLTPEQISEGQRLARQWSKR